MTIRSFIGIFAPREIRSTIKEIQSSLKEQDPSVRWEKEEKLHITMKFLGNTEEARLSSLCQELEKSFESFSSFEVRLTSVGAFPPGQNPRIIWIGSSLKENERLAECWEIVEKVCSEHGFKKEERAFHPHITLGRVKSRASDGLMRALQTVRFEPLFFPCREIAVMKSVLSSSGSTYSPFKQVSLMREHSG